MRYDACEVLSRLTGGGMAKVQTQLGDEVRQRRRRSREERERAESVARERQARRERKERLRETSRRPTVSEQNTGEGGAALTKLAAEGLRREHVLADDGSLNTVNVRGFSMRWLDKRHQDAVRRFCADWEMAYRGLQSPKFEPRVDGGRAHAAYLTSISAQKRLSALREKLGLESWVVLVAFAVYGGGPTEFERHGAPRREVVADRIKQVLRRVDEFYSDTPAGVDDTIRAAHRIIEATGFDRSDEAAAELRKLLGV